MALATAGWGGSALPAFAHASDRGFVLLLPTGHYLVGGALAVAASFLVLTFVGPASLARLSALRIPFPSPDERWRAATSLAAFAVMAVLVAAGLFGSRDPLSNPLPLAVWTLLWVALTLVQGLAGDLWRWINPWHGPVRLVEAIFGRAADASPRLVLPAWLGAWPAVAAFFGFAWFELVYPAPDDPARLAVAVALWWGFSFVAMLVFGEAEWSRRGEFLSAFWSLVARYGIAGRVRSGENPVLALPGARLADAEPLSSGAVALLLLALASVTFDGFLKTFAWLGFIGVNPLEFPGRTALMAANTAGLAGAFAALSATFLACLALGRRLAGAPARGVLRDAGLLVWSLLPIALAYHFAHYLTALLVNGQYALVALSDPFSLGWNLFGTAHMPVAAAIASGSDAAWTVWNLQAAAIVAGHVLAVLAAHLIAFRLHGQPRAALLSQVPLTALMIAYTVLGLWLLSTPTGA